MTDDWGEVQTLLEQLPVEIARKVVLKAERKAAKIIAARAKELVPVKSGLLKRSIGVKKAKAADTPKGKNRYYIVPKSIVKRTRKAMIDGIKGKVKITQHAFYGRFVEMGTVKMPSHPYLAPAAEQTLSQVTQVFRDEIKKGVEQWHS